MTGLVRVPVPFFHTGYATGWFVLGELVQVEWAGDENGVTKALGWAAEVRRWGSAADRVREQRSWGEGEIKSE